MWGNPKLDFGTTQYIDALQRAEWYPSDASDGNWHTLFQLNSVVSVAISVPSSSWRLANEPCGLLGEVDEASLDSTVRGLISYLTSLGIVSPNTLPVILLSNVASYTTDKAGNVSCCALGYHSAFGSPLQVYALAMFDTTGGIKGSADIAALSHEMAETMNNPTVTNWTPPWGNVGQVTGCQSNFEVGDPLTGTQYPPITLSGYTYHPQELAMMPWFYEINSGLGWYSTNGTFKSPSSMCINWGPPFLVSNNPVLPD